MSEKLALAIFVGAALLSALLVEVIRRWALRREKLDIPNERSSHTVPTPRGGGLAIVVVSLTGWLLINLFVWHRFDATVWAYPLGAALIAAVSWIDDLRGLSNSVRFAAHSIAALIAIAVYGYWQSLALPGPVFSEINIAGVLLTFIWIVGLTNAYNFMDGLDGIAAGQAVVAGVGWICLGNWLSHFSANGSSVSWLGIWAYATVFLNPQAIGLLGLFLTASSLGFLWHNRPPARIFMGDVGSAFLGYSFSVAPLLTASHGKGIVYRFAEPFPSFAVPAILLVWPFLFDTIFTFIRRALKREKVFQAHRSHLFQRLNIAGCSHGFVTLLYSALAAAGGWLAIEWTSGRRTAPMEIYAPLLTGMLGLWLFTRCCEMRARGRSVRM